MGDRVRITARNELLCDWIGDIVALHRTPGGILYAVHFHDDVKPVWFEAAELRAVKLPRPA